MKKTGFFKCGWTAWAISLLFCVAAQGQVVNRDAIDALLNEGEIEKAEKTLSSYLKSEDLTFQDSIYLLKNLGVLYSSSPDKKEEGDKFFYKLLELDPFSSLHNTYAGNSILARFKKIRKNYQSQKGGKALVPAVVVFDFSGQGLEPGDGGTMALQLIAEMQRLETFHAMDRSAVLETMGKMKMTPEKCQDQKCRMDIAQRLTTDKMISAEVAKVDSLFTITLNFIDVESGQTTTTLRKVFNMSLDKLLSEGFAQLADELQSKEAAWLNLTLIPSNTILTIDGSPMAVIASRVPLNPGKHRICGNSPGYETICKTFEVKRTDAVTYALVLPQVGGEAAAARMKKKAAEEEAEEETDQNAGGKGTSGTFIWWTLGVMAAIAVGTAVFLNI